MKNFRIHSFLVFCLLAILFFQCQRSEPGSSEWFAFVPRNTPLQGVIGMKDWLDAPAGNHGFVQMNGSVLECEDGTPIKFWGTNICSNLPFAEKETAEEFAAFLAKYGVNAVRFHKFSWHGYDDNSSTALDADKFKKLDYFHSVLKQGGIYTGWSHIYGHRVQPGDSVGLLAYTEIKNLNYPWAHLNGSTSSLVNFAPDLQDLSIALTVNMLNHVNPYTGLRYADDPALAFVEFQNEDNIFWSAIERSLEQAPTYRSLLCQQFSDWLLEKYRNQVELNKAWGAGALPADESLEKRNIYPQPNHGLFSYEYELAIKENRPLPAHLLDKMTFLYETQVKFYKKFEEAVRDTGYKGVLVGSCWQAGSGISHLYNLHADYEAGMIDRHNYYGGGAGGHQLDTGKVNNLAMVQNPGSGLLSAGMQQVAGRPFSFSEWMSLVPNEWTAEAAPIIAIYGMGLQGWDASFSFAADIPRFSSLLESEGHGVYNATSPLHMGLYPALARMIYRNDVSESPVLLTRNVHIPSLSTGKTSFNEMVSQGFDDKNITGTIPAKALAIGRVPIDFQEDYQETNIPDLLQSIGNDNKILESITNELKWQYDSAAHFTVNTPATKGAVGFFPNETIVLGDWSITTANKFAVILITSLDKKKTLDETSAILITAVARGRNTGMEYSADGAKLLSKGNAPLLLEPVVAQFKIPDGDYIIEPLDQDGQATGNIHSIENNTLTIDTGTDKTIWYLLTRK